MLTQFLAAATADAAPVNHFGFFEALQQGGVIAYSIFTVLVIMSVGSFYILVTKLLEQRKVFAELNEVRTKFWQAPSLRDGASKLDKNGAWRQLVDDGLAAEE